MSAPLANAVPWSREGSLAHPHRVPGDRLGGEPALQEGAHRDRMPACLAALRAAHAGAENADSAKRLGGVVTRGAIGANGTHTESAREAGAPMRRPSTDRRRTRRSWRSPRSTPTTSGPKCPLRWPLRPAVLSGRPSRRSATTKGALSQDTVRLMVFKLVMAAGKTWRRLKGENQLPKVIRGVTFRDGVEVTDTPEQTAA
jgi:hypothetical protein